MKIIITGGAGFIGSHLSRKLSENHEVIIIDDFSTGSREHINNIKGIKIINHDIENPMTDMIWIQEHDLQGVEQIYHLACPASPVSYQKNPIKTVKTNCVGTINVLDLARALNCRVLLASTSEIYGDPEQHPQVETYWGNVCTTGPRACYDEGKRIAETLLYDYHRYYGLDVRCVRIFNTYGPHMAENDGRVVSNFIMQALRGENITVYGDGSQTRSFCFVSDLIKGLELVMNQNERIMPINLGNPHETTIRELADMIVQMVCSNSKVVYKDLPENDPKVRKANIGVMQSLTGWKPTISLEEGLQKTIEYFGGRL